MNCWIWRTNNDDYIQMYHKWTRLLWIQINSCICVVLNLGFPEASLLVLQFQQFFLVNLTNMLIHWSFDNKLLSTHFGAKYLVFISSHSFKMRELSFTQFVYFLRKVCLFFNDKHTFFKKYKNLAKLSSLILRERGETKTRYFAP